MLNNDKSGNLTVTLIDFGFAKEYLNQNGQPFSETEELETFEGNVLFASTNHLEFKITQPRDDLISICYLMIYLLNENDLPFRKSFFKSHRGKNLHNLDIMK